MRPSAPMITARVRALLELMQARLGAMGRRS